MELRFGFEAALLLHGEGPFNWRCSEGSACGNCGWMSGRCGSRKTLLRVCIGRLLHISVQNVWTASCRWIPSRSTITAHRSQHLLSGAARRLRAPQPLAGWPGLNIQTLTPTPTPTPTSTLTSVQALHICLEGLCSCLCLPSAHPGDFIASIQRSS